MKLSSRVFASAARAFSRLVSVIPTGVPAVPASPVLVSPASNAVNVGLSPALQVNVSESDGGSESFMLKVVRPHIITLRDFNGNLSDTKTGAGTLVPVIGSSMATTSQNRDVIPLSFDPNLGTDIWKTLATAPTVDNSENVVVPTNSNESRFFRLVH